VKTENSENPDRKCRILRDKELHLNRGETDVKGPHVVGGYSRRLRKQHQAKEAASWAEVGLGRPALATSRPGRPPFNLDAIWAIYSPETRCHASILSPSAAKEQRRDGHHLGEERVELVV
jgi:hypothetical protein